MALFSNRVTRVYIFILLVLALPACADGASNTSKTSNKSDERYYDLTYHVALHPETSSAKVRIEIANAQDLVWLDFNIDKKYHTNFTGNGELTVAEGNVKWVPPAKDAMLTYDVAINRARKKESGGKQYDAYMSPQWAIFRGDDLIPSARVRAKKGAKSKSVLVFDLPKNWSSVNSGWPKALGHSESEAYFIDNPSRRFDRPTGWFIAGDLGTRRVKLGETYLSVSAPKESEFRRMDILTMLTFVWPQVANTFEVTPAKILIVGAGKPMWRGGLSSPNSLYLHEDRPLVSENGTSTILHEIFHVVSGISGDKNNDWVAEGLAEFYAIEWLYRAGGLTDTRRNIVLADLEKWSKNVTTLLGKNSTGEVTAKAVLYFEELNNRLLKKSKGTVNLDAFVAELFDNKKITVETINTLCTNYEIECPAVTFNVKD